MGQVYWTGEMSGRPLQADPSGPPRYSKNSASMLSGLFGALGGGKNPAPSAPGFQWQFPQYSQDWAFTPPTPSRYTPPPAFNSGAKTPFGGMIGNAGGTTTTPDFSSILQRFRQPAAPTSGMTLQQLMAKYYNR